MSASNQYDLYEIVKRDYQNFIIINIEYKTNGSGSVISTNIYELGEPANSYDELLPALEHYRSQ